MHLLLADEWVCVGIIRNAELTDRADRLPLGVEPVLQGRASMSERVFQSEYFKEIPKARALLRLGLSPHREGAGSVAATSRRCHLGGLHSSDVSSVSKNRIAVGEVVTPLRLQVGRMAERAGAEVRQKASEDPIKLQALRTAHDPDER